MFCPVCGEWIADEIINKEVSLLIHRVFRHEPALATALSLGATVLVGWGVQKVLR
jgi:hypothetical protein